MKSASRKQKGSRLEREVASRIRSTLKDYGIEAKRMLMSGAISGWKADIFTNLPVSIECKNQEAVTHFWEWWEQAENQAGLGKLPILVVSKNFNKEPIACMKLEDLLFFFELALQSGWVSSIRRGRKLIR